MCSASNFLGHGNRSRALPGEAKRCEEGPCLGGAATKAGELVDAFDGLGGGADRAFGERLFDRLRVIGEFAHGDVPVAAFEPRQAAIAVGKDVAFGGGDADRSNACGLFAGVPEVNGPEDEHFASDKRVGVPVAVVQDDGLFIGRKCGPEPNSHPWLPVWGGRRSVRAPADQQ